VDVSLGALRQRLLDMRAWDSSGSSLDNRIREAINNAMDRMAGDVPEAIVPDEEHVVLRASVLSGDTGVDAYVKVNALDKRLLEFVDSSRISIGYPASSTSWRPSVDGTWDGIMHIEVKDPDGQWHRRQCREFFYVQGNSNTERKYYVTLDRPWQNNTDGVSVTPMEFRVHQPEFFVRDDVMELLEPAVVWDDTRRQIWAIDTGGASRFDLTDLRGEAKGRPSRMWRSRHFQLPAPTEAPIVLPMTTHGATHPWAGTESLKAGKFKVCYTYVWGRRESEWQQSPAVMAGGHTAITSQQKLFWAHDSANGTPTLGDEAAHTGIHDPLWESAPSPVTEFEVGEDAAAIAGTNIDAMMGFGDETLSRYGRTGLRLRFYVAHTDYETSGRGEYARTETSERFHLLCEVEPTFDQTTGILAPTMVTPGGCRFIWTGDQLYDYHRPLRHSTGYYAWKVYPHQDARYELDLRVLRLPQRLVDDQDTPPIKRDAVSALLELSLYYVSLLDGADQSGAQVHLDRYNEVVKTYRKRYGNPGRVVEPRSLRSGGTRFTRFGTFDS